MAVSNAYADGVLMTEAEWVETLSLRFEKGTDDMGVVTNDV